MAKIIGISGISGAGKTSLAKKLGAKLNATTLSWDDYDDISEAPSDFARWYNTSRDYNDWRYDALAETLKILKAGKDIICPATGQTLISTPYIIFDTPSGYEHVATGQHIDYLIFLDTPLDIALARRLIRDYPDGSQTGFHEILEELKYYLTASRPLYELGYQMKYKSDLILSGSLPIDQQVQLILPELESFSANLDILSKT